LQVCVEGSPQLRFSVNDERAIGVEDLNEGWLEVVEVPLSAPDFSD